MEPNIYLTVTPNWLWTKSGERTALSFECANLWYVLTLKESLASTAV